MQSLFETVTKIGPLINQHIDEEENNRRLSQPVIQILRESGLHKLFMPESIGGYECDPLTVAKLVEEVAHYNTGAAWSMMVANVSTWW